MYMTKRGGWILDFSDRKEVRKKQKVKHDDGLKTENINANEKKGEKGKEKEEKKLNSLKEVFKVCILNVNENHHPLRVGTALTCLYCFRFYCTFCCLPRFNLHSSIQLFLLPLLTLLLTLLLPIVLLLDRRRLRRRVARELM